MNFLSAFVVDSTRRPQVTTGSVSSLTPNVSEIIATHIDRYICAVKSSQKSEIIVLHLDILTKAKPWAVEAARFDSIGELACSLKKLSF